MLPCAWTLFYFEQIFHLLNYKGRPSKHSNYSYYFYSAAAKPVLKIVKQNVEGVKRDTATLSIRYENDVVSKWIFMGKVMNSAELTGYTFDKYQSDEDQQLVQEDLVIDVLRDADQGIYTAQVTKDGCSTMDTIYLNVGTSQDL